MCSVCIEQATGRGGLKKLLPRKQRLSPEGWEKRAGEDSISIQVWKQNHESRCGLTCGGVRTLYENLDQHWSWHQCRVDIRIFQLFILLCYGNLNI